ncbi:MAG: spore coat associated protein CotJA [Huintestinicola sp.]
MNESNRYPKCGYRNFTVPEGKFPDETPLAMAYVPYQSWEKPYEENKALEAGTIFPSLDMPFKGKELYRR